MKDNGKQIEIPEEEKIKRKLPEKECRLVHLE